MKKAYTFGEIVFVLREEYKDCELILNELRRCVRINSKYDKSYFSASLLYDDYPKDEVVDRHVFLAVMKKYSKVLKAIEYLRKGWYVTFLDKAVFNTKKNDNGLYELNYDDTKTWFDQKKYIPTIEIVDQEKMSFLIDQLFRTDLMHLKEAFFEQEDKVISLEFDKAFIDAPRSYISWNGLNDSFNYYANSNNNFLTIQNLFSLEIPNSEIPKDWLDLLEKHEGLLGDGLYYQVINNLKNRRGVLQIVDINNDIVKLERK